MLALSKHLHAHQGKLAGTSNMWLHRHNKPGLSKPLVAKLVAMVLP
jgi:hypothetical protein